MKVDVLNNGPINANCYFLYQDNKVIVVDPGAKYVDIKNKIKDHELVAIFITHDHFDHVDSLDELLEYYPAPINPSEVDGYNYEIVKTPGHSKDSISFYFPNEKIIIIGDFLFHRGIGYTHFPGGNNKEMIDSLNLIREYPDDLVVYPGHDEIAILGEEKALFDHYIDSLKK